MDITLQLSLITLGMAVGFGVIAAQSIAIARILHSRAGWYKAAAFALIGLLQVWTFVRLSAAINEARAKGALPDSLPLTQWVRVGVIFIAVGLLIAGFDRMRRDLRKLGI